MELRPGSILYYTDEDAIARRRPRGKIPLGRASRVVKLEGDEAPRTRGAGLDWMGRQLGNGMPFCFSVTSDGGEVVLFQASGDGDRKAWVNAVQEEVERLQGPGR